MKTSLVRGLLVIAPFLSAMPASASTLFAGSGGFANTLTISTPDGPVVFTTNQGVFEGSTNNQGWWDSTGSHGAENDNYYTSNALGGGTNSFFTFLLSGFAGDALEATLTIRTTDTSGSGLPATYSLFDVSTAAATLNGDGFSNVDVFNDLSSGQLYGAMLVSSYPTTAMNITLNAAALNDINSGAGGYFSIGGTLSPAESSTPEPGTISLMAAGLLAVFVARRRLSAPAVELLCAQRVASPTIHLQGLR